MNANKTHFMLLVVFTLILWSMVSLFVKTIPLALAHAIYFCQRAFLNAAIISHGTPFILLLLLSFIFLIGIIVFAFQVFKTELFINKTLKRSIVPSKKIKALTHSLGLDNKIHIIEDKNRFSFCYGLFRPRICLSSGLVANITSDELKAVLLHENYHVKNRDSLRIILGKTASLMFFFIPTLKDIQAHYVFSKEVAADELVIKEGKRMSLISALTKLLSPNVPSFYGVATFASSQDLERRILYLTNQKQQASIKLSKRNLSFSIIVVMLLFLALNAPIHAIAMNDNAHEQSYFVCPFGGECANSCKKELQSRESKNFSENVIYTPIQ